MANKRICIQIDFDGPSPLIPNATSFDKYTSMTNLARLIRGIDHGSQFRRTGPTTVVVQQSLVQATGTVTAAAVAAADTVSIGGTAMTATQLRSKGTITCATAAAADTVTINGVVFVGKTGAATPGTLFFSVDTSDTATAASIAAQILAYADPRLSGVVEAKSAAAVVTVYAASLGAAGNAYTLASSSNTTLAVSGATLAGGASPANNQFDYVGNNNEVAADLARCANASTSANIKQATASAASAVVTFTALTPGVAGNAIALATSNNTRLAKSGTTLTGGTAGAPTAWKF